MHRIVALPLARLEDKVRSVEPSGEVTDPHKVTASRIYGIPYDAVTAEQREVGKRRNYLDMYSAPVAERKCE